ncbi:hypothetical protein CRG98_041515 [Punica granatum]|uniref:Uncharacterized protein n=1 Tax=Punica granatum TaxID=22663 RepID=A0A2I0I3S9_PUNGR|nr:hypothetical protein CRG98_041515 [Punica granatum]
MGRNAGSLIGKSNEEACTSNSDASQKRYSPEEERAMALMIHVVSITVLGIKELNNFTAWNNAYFPKLILSFKDILMWSIDMRDHINHMKDYLCPLRELHILEALHGFKNCVNYMKHKLGPFSYSLADIFQKLVSLRTQRGS